MPPRNPLRVRREEEEETKNVASIDGLLATAFSPIELLSPAAAACSMRFCPSQNSVDCVFHVEIFIVDEAKVERKP